MRVNGMTLRRDPRPWPADARWTYGQYVQKRKGSMWRGMVVGWYTTDITAHGYAVVSWYEHNSVQCWPEAALEDWAPPMCGGRHDWDDTDHCTVCGKLRDPV